MGDLISPWLGLIVGSSLNNAYIVLNRSKVCYPAGPRGTDVCSQWKTLDDAKAAGAITFNYGHFIQVSINFLLVSCVVFFLVRAYQRVRDAEAKRGEETPAAPA
eukprot:NODE_3403_length_448_cov_114.706767_g2974_i0.p1 GENE.NODE_3403_length_448_cov_114.706767_g2974_i0~~NODE_3403_length_448_cov_114.706767_g2974_i0.p1  ORF type:complete len:104 (+),score=9.95 NODE_3403_length_448_cov_114.706767_g2974_i0:31-342(+)